MQFINSNEQLILTKENIADVLEGLGFNVFMDCICNESPACTYSAHFGVDDDEYPEIIINKVSSSIDKKLSETTVKNMTTMDGDNEIWKGVYKIKLSYREYMSGELSDILSLKAIKGRPLVCPPSPYYIPDLNNFWYETWLY